MSYATFNGWNIIPLPSPAPQRISWSMADSVGENVSPFTRQAQLLQWPGADWWEIEVQMAPLTVAQARAWFAWLAALRGKTNVFQLGDPLGKNPRGTPAGTPVTTATNNLATATFLYTQGWTPNATNLLLPGDWIQLGYRLHMVAGVSAVNADGSGLATIEIYPSLRETTQSTALTLTNCKGLFRLAENKRQVSEEYTKLFGLTFKAVEAR